MPHRPLSLSPARPTELRSRALLDEHGNATARGRQEREHIEDATNRLAQRLLRPLREPDADRLLHTLTPAVRAITSCGVLPFPTRSDCPARTCPADRILGVPQSAREPLAAGDSPARPGRDRQARYPHRLARRAGCAVSRTRHPVVRLWGWCDGSRLARRGQRPGRPGARRRSGPQWPPGPDGRASPAGRCPRSPARSAAEAVFTDRTRSRLGRSHGVILPGAMPNGPSTPCPCRPGADGRARSTSRSSRTASPCRSCHGRAAGRFPRKSSQSWRRSGCPGPDRVLTHRAQRENRESRHGTTRRVRRTPGRQTAGAPVATWRWTRLAGLVPAPGIPPGYWSRAVVEGLRCGPRWRAGRCLRRAGCARAATARVPGRQAGWTVMVQRRLVARVRATYKSLSPPGRLVMISSGFRTTTVSNSRPRASDAGTMRAW